MTTVEAIARLVELAKREHGISWNTDHMCPIAKYRTGSCTCGTDEHNAEVERVAAILSASAQSPASC